EAVEQIRLGGSVIDPSLVRELLGAYRSDDPLGQLTPEERDVLALMAQGHSDNGIAKELGVSEEHVGRHVHGVLTKLGLPESGTDRHRVLAVLAYLGAR
ncbi:MAG: response regulator transcription factor, partial [Actinobacteria bacterium]|nr:response regulator transcription factor [Actinomycetota bacterium]